ncbi:3-phosphoserine/phosphohydroxythreonine transaminase [Aliikangiella sp. G2MR2-5]|uniref:3-phosphoserine/phosphohydroxythreonine transaminase n=1 Tax=Aliikangiella sp. G2MR2-5 TaxID=2788943 RepID=UPI0018A9819C
MTNQTYNFCAGPAALPVPVMQKAQQELLNWRGLGVSVMEVSHRSSEYQELANKAESDLRKLMGIGEEHAVLFMHGGASLQFSSIPMSLLSENKTAEYIENGIWSSKAAQEAARYGKINSIPALQMDDSGIRSLSSPSTWTRSESPVYTHYTPNETIEGIRFPFLPETNGSLIADLSSCILSEKLNMSDFDMIYAGAQKNIGPAGMTIVIVKHELMDKMDFSRVPKVFNYKAQAEQGSMINTPPTYAWYLASLVFEWLLEQGGVEGMEKLAHQRANLLYSYLDSDDFYHNPIAPEYRSLMNVPFILKDESLNDKFLKEARSAGLVGLKGHRSVGGMRASIYNSMPIEGVEALIAFMKEFKQQNG